MKTSKKVTTRGNWQCRVSKHRRGLLSPKNEVAVKVKFHKQSSVVWRAKRLVPTPWSGQCSSEHAVHRFSLLKGSMAPFNLYISGTLIIELSSFYA